MAQENKNTQEKKPWYKYPMVWFVITLPAIAVVASFATLVIAVKNAPVVIEQNESYKAKINTTKE
ncbi:MAG: FixH family protein [Marinicellaceae bacterium]